MLEDFRANVLNPKIPEQVNPRNQDPAQKTLATLGRKVRERPPNSEPPNDRCSRARSARRNSWLRNSRVAPKESPLAGYLRWLEIVFWRAQTGF